MIPPARRKALTSWTTTTVIMEANLTTVTTFVSRCVSRSRGGDRYNGNGLAKIWLPIPLAYTNTVRNEGGRSIKIVRISVPFCVQNSILKASLSKDKGLLNSHCSVTSSIPSLYLQGTKSSYSSASCFLSHAIISGRLTTDGKCQDARVHVIRDTEEERHDSTHSKSRLLMDTWLSSRHDRFVPRKEPPLPIPHGTKLTLLEKRKIT